MEVPSSSLFFNKRREKFYSDEASSRYEAMEGACESVMMPFHTCVRNILFLVEDINYREVRPLEHRALAAETWSNLPHDVVECGRKDNETMRDAYALLFGLIINRVLPVNLLLDAGVSKICILVSRFYWWHLF